jgi:hypothetical protein|tara:strand:+ start:1824 stop:2291 length:468 start_codon:yes stop_codon:yes gene_type:complete
MVINYILLFLGIDSPINTLKMKKIALVLIISISSLFGFGQSLEKGNLMGLHVLDITLNDGVTSQQFEDYYINTVIPNYDKAYPGAKIYLADGFVGEYKGSLSMIWVFESTAVRNAYFGSNANELSQETQDKLKSVDDGLALLGSWTSKFTDWSIR